MTQTLSGEGVAALLALGSSPASTDMEAVWSKYGTRYGYDVADRLILKTEPNGTNATGLKTSYYYGADGQLTHVVNALGEVTEYRYNAFGERTDVVVYSGRIPTATLTPLTGGPVTAALTDALAAIAGAAASSTTSLVYNVTGTVAKATDAMGVDTLYSYNSFRQRLTTTTTLSDTALSVTSLAYDRRGLVASQTVDSAAGGLQLTTSYGYDAFGRAIQVTGPGVGQTRLSGYDRAGRVVSTTDATGVGVQTFTYDARSNLLTSVDRTEKVTSYTYDAFSRTVTVKTPELLVTTTRSNAYGQTVSITDGGGRTIAYAYDKDGQVKTVTDAGAVVQQTNSYDAAGKLIETVDARGVITRYTYDAVNRVLKRTVDPSDTDPATVELNLVTLYAYDAKGQQVQVTDPSGVVTTIGYDLNGRRVSVTVDPSTTTPAYVGLNLTTTYDYDKAGRQVKVTEGAGTAAARTTRYDYDKADRLIASVVDPSTTTPAYVGLNLTTSFIYDKAGNVVSRTDAGGGGHPLRLRRREPPGLLGRSYRRGRQDRV